MLAKRVLELRPSRKRRREDMEAGDGGTPGDDLDDETPFVDDLVGVGGPPGTQQHGFFDMRGPGAAAEAEQETHELHPLPPGLPAIPPLNDEMIRDDPELSTPTNAEQEIRELHPLPPGLPVATANMPRTPVVGGSLRVALSLSHLSMNQNKNWYHQADVQVLPLP